MLRFPEVIGPIEFALGSGSALSAVQYICRNANGEQEFHTVYLVKDCPSVQLSSTMIVAMLGCPEKREKVRQQMLHISGHIFQARQLYHLIQAYVSNSEKIQSLRSLESLFRERKSELREQVQISPLPPDLCGEDFDGTVYATLPLERAILLLLEDSHVGLKFFIFMIMQFAEPLSRYLNKCSTEPGIMPMIGLHMKYWTDGVLYGSGGFGSKHFTLLTATIYQLVLYPVRTTAMSSRVT